MPRMINAAPPRIDSQRSVVPTFFEPDSMLRSF
jgi:hypothetical protein